MFAEQRKEKIEEKYWKGKGSWLYSQLYIVAGSNKAYFSTISHLLHCFYVL
jgi:hypothetical protein